MNLPTKLTLSRVIMVPFFVVFILLVPKFLYFKWIALAIFIIASLTDLLDGKIARKYNQVTNFGKFMDPLADKMLVLTAMCYFVDNNTMSGWVVALVLLREFGVSGLRLLAVEQGTVIAAAWSGKIKTFITMVTLGLLIVVAEPWVPFKEVIPPVCSALIVISTLYSGAEYFVKNINVFKRCD